MLDFFKGFGADDAFGLLRHAATIAGPLIAAAGIGQGDEGLIIVGAAETIFGSAMTAAGVVASLADPKKRAARAERRRRREAQAGR